MEHQPAKKRRGPKSRAGKILLNLVITAIVGFGKLFPDAVRVMTVKKGS